MDAIFFKLRTGCQWAALEVAGFGKNSTLYGWYSIWRDLKVFHNIYLMALNEYDECHGIDWTWLSLDCCMTKSPLGGESTGPNPTDRGKLGTKRSCLVDAVGIPLAICVAGANVHDMKLY